MNKNKIINLIKEQKLITFSSLIEENIIGIDSLLDKVKNSIIVESKYGKIENMSEDKIADAIIEIIAPECIYKRVIGTEGSLIIELAKAIIETNDAEYIYYFAKDIKGAPIDLLEDAIIKTGSTKFMYLFARDIEGAHVNKLLDGILGVGYIDLDCLFYFARDVKGASVIKIARIFIKTKKAKKIYEFALLIKDAPIEELADAIIEIGDPIFICEFASDIKGAPISKLLKAILKVGDPVDLCRFAKQVKGIGIDEVYLLAKKLMALAKKEKCYAEICYFAREIKDAPVEELFDFILKSNNKEYIVEFLLTVDSIPSACLEKSHNKLQGILKDGLKIDNILNDKNTNFKCINRLVKLNLLELDYLNDMIFESPRINITKICRFTKDIGIINICKYVKKVEGVSIEEVTNWVIKVGEAYHIYEFAREIKNASVDRLAEAIIKKQGPFYIYLFARDIEGAPIDKLLDALIEIGDSIFVFYFVRDVKGINENQFNKIFDFVINSNDPKIIYEFTKAKENQLTELKIAKLVKAIIMTNNLYYMNKFNENITNISFETKVFLNIQIINANKSLDLFLKSTSAEEDNLQGKKRIKNN